MKKNLPSWGPGHPGHHLLRPLLALLFCCSLSTVKGQINLVKDINTSPSRSLNEYSGLVNVSGTLYYIVNGSEVWKTDGYTSTKVKTFATVQRIMPVGGNIFLVADDSVKGFELWKTDGTEGGTVLVKDIAPGFTSSSPNTLTSNNSILYFIADDGKKGREVWRSDGTNAGTYLLKDIANAGGHCNCRDFVSYNNNLYFVALDSKGYEIWQSDGTKDGTHVLRDIKPGKLSSSPNNLTVSGNYLYFSAKDDAHGEEVWRTDGTEAGTQVFKDVWPGPTSSFPTNFADAGSQLFFKANDGVHAFEFWRTDGTLEGTHLVADIGKGKGNGIGGFLNACVGLNGKLYFILGRTAYVSDGTEAGTRILGELQEFYERKAAIVYNNEVYVVDIYEDNVNILKKITDSGLVFIRQLNEPNEEYADVQTMPTTSGDYLYLVGEVSQGSSVSLLRSDGTADGTVEINDAYYNTSNSNPSGFLTVGNTMYFNANDGSSHGLWKTDGTTMGTSLVKYLGYNMSPLTEFNSDLLLVAGTSYYKNQLWKSDGTSSGTTMLKSFDQYATTGQSFSEYKGNVFFNSGSELWKTDGTEEGTLLVKQFGCCDSSPSSFATKDNTLYFFANDGANGRELWKTDGTTTGTSMVVDLTLGFSSTNILQSFTFNNKIYFVKIDGSYYSGPFSVWKSDGTAAGTVRVAACDNRVVQRLDPIGNALYFIGYDPVVPGSKLGLYKLDSTEQVTKIKDVGSNGDYVNIVGIRDGKLVFNTYNYNAGGGNALWVSDGTTGGTTKLADVQISHVVVKDHILYFYVTNTWPYQFWRSDGTVCGTYRITARDVGSPEIAVLGNKVLLSGSSVVHGNELYSYNIPAISPSPCGMGGGRIATDSESLIKEEASVDAILVRQHPNPFASNFTLHVKGTTSEKDFEASIINMNGSRLESYTDMKRNTDYLLGSNLPGGLYILRVVVDGKVITKRISKIK